MRSRWGALAAAVAVMLLSVPAAVQADPTPPPSYDVAALGASGSGLVGSTVQITVGVQNVGLVSTEHPDVELNPKRLFTVELPAGTEVVEQPSILCTAAIVEPADPRRFNCAVATLEPGKRQDISFHVRITGAVTGTGKVATSAYGPGTDLDADHTNDTAPITITSLRGYDMVAIGDTVHGQVGSVVEITVGVKNLGPERAPGSGGSGAPKHAFGVLLPEGTELVEDPSILICRAVALPPTNPRGFNCAIEGPAPGVSQLVTVKVRIIAPTSAPGRITRGFSGDVPDLDINRANDTAPITITTGQLPQTGTDSKTIAVIGSGAVLLGGLLLLVMRRFGKRRE